MKKTLHSREVRHYAASGQMSGLFVEKLQQVEENRVVGMALTRLPME